MIFSDKQESIFKEVKEGSGHISVQATAGAGKTTTILNALKFVPITKKSIFLSFSNGIVNELKSRVPAHIKASTLHSLGLRMISSSHKVKVDGSKYLNEALLLYDKSDKWYINKENFKNCVTIQDICSFARMTLTEFKRDELIDLCDHYGIIWTFDLIDKAIKLLKKHTKLKGLKIVDFSDMIFLLAKYPELINEKFDYIFLDESQDTNKAQFQFIENILAKDGRLVSVGDNRQVVFGFAGSDIDSFQRIRERKNTVPLPLTVTYRCAKKIVELAQTVYPNDIEAHPTAPEGEVRDGDILEAVEGDMVLCRNTRPLVACFFRLLEANKKSFIVGKDLEKGLSDLAESFTKKALTKEEVIENITKKLQSILQELKDNGVFEPTIHPKYLNMLEKCDIIRFILGKVNKVIDVVPKVHDLFMEDSKKIKLLTIHRSKGLEAGRVFFIKSFNNEILCPSKHAKKPWELTQENNLLFVCYTRAKEKFFFIDFEENKF